MDEFEIPKDVQNLLHDRIESYEELEVLLFLAQEPAVVVTSKLVSEEMQIPRSLASHALVRLRDNGLVEPDGVADGYRYRPREVRLGRSVERLRDAYDHHRVGIVKLMSTNAVERIRMAAVRTFADAFVVRRNRDRTDG